MKTAARSHNKVVNTEALINSKKKGEDEELDLNAAADEMALSTQDVNVLRLLGREGFNSVMRRIMKFVGRYPPL